MSYKYFERSSIYHSELRRVTEEGTGISFMVVSDPKLSKDKVNTIFKIAPYGDADQYWLQAENDRVRDVLASMPKNTHLIVKAHGDRDSAYLEITDVDGNPLTSLDDAVDTVPDTPPQVPQGPTGIKPPDAPNPSMLPPNPALEQPPAPPSSTEQAAAPPTQPTVPAGVPVVQDRREKTDALMLDCLNRAHEIVSRYGDLHGKPEDFANQGSTVDLIQRVGVSLFIHES